jgi:hypothetical protein
MEEMLIFISVVSSILTIIEIIHRITEKKENTKNRGLNRHRKDIKLPLAKPKQKRVNRIVLLAPQKYF